MTGNTVLQRSQYGPFRKAEAFNLPGVAGFLARAGGDSSSDPTYITRAQTLGGPYRATNQLNVVYGNVDWKATVDGKFRVLSWAGPAWRYTNFFTAAFLAVGDTSNRSIYERGKLVATAPYPVIGAAFKRINNQTWIRAMCWQPSTLDWVAVEKVLDAAPADPDSWDEVGRFPFSAVGESEPALDDLRKQYQFEATAFFNSTATKAIGIHHGYKTFTTKVPFPYLIDFDWPTTSGGPVTFSQAEACNMQSEAVVIADEVDDIQYTITITGRSVTARDWDADDNEVQGSVESDGTLTVAISSSGSMTTRSVTDTRNERRSAGGHDFRAWTVFNPGSGSMSSDSSGPSSSASGTFTRVFSHLAGFDLRTGFVSGYEDVTEYNYFDGAGIVGDSEEDRSFTHTSYFLSSLGTIVHVSDTRPTILATFGEFDFLVSYAITPTPGVTDIVRMPRAMVSSGGVFTAGNTQGDVRYQSDQFGNEFAFLNYATHIYYTIPLALTVLNPAYPPENLLTGGDVQSLHGIAFTLEQVGIA